MAGTAFLYRAFKVNVSKCADVCAVNIYAAAKKYIKGKI